MKKVQILHCKKREILIQKLIDGGGVLYSRIKEDTEVFFYNEIKW